MITIIEARAEHVSDIVALIGQLRAQEGLEEHNDADQAAYRSRGFECDGVYFELHLNG